MKSLLLLSAGILLSGCVSTQPDEEVMARYLEGSYAERAEICAQYVASRFIGACAAPQGELVPQSVSSEDQFIAAADECIAEGKTETNQIVYCANAKLNQQEVMQKATKADWKAAAELCMQQESETTKVASCISGYIQNIEAEN